MSAARQSRAGRTSTIRPCSILSLSLLLLSALPAHAAANFLLPLPPSKLSQQKGSVQLQPLQKEPLLRRETLTRIAVAPVAAPLLLRAVRTLLRLPRRLMSLVPARLPRWWQSSGLTANGVARAIFLGSNVAYLAAGVRLLSSATPTPLGWLMVACCAVSTAYHSMQCAHGCESEQAAKWCYIDTTVAVSSGLCFARAAGPRCLRLLPTIFGAFSLAFFLDVFSLGYTTTHSLWHVSSALAAVFVAR
ncbi:hypothetical protein AB1Y20_014708 [Prymnesium parvum]|uniref:Post-GPI attachment to proteins factor 3 n=1 Tax=Prymnesium parvum TaxID=97485 RepID=A0AB34IBG7_PRYPA